jgi:SAM-dependent methyltransferase
MDPLFDGWVAALEARHLADLTFPEVSRALRALSAAYVERRHRLGEGAALSGAGKRAAFALFYGPLHYLLVREIGRALGVGAPPSEARQPTPRRLVDLGCGTGAAGAAWAISCGAGAAAPIGHPIRRDPIVAVDRHPWALGEAAWTYPRFGLSVQTRQGDIASVRLPVPPCDTVAAFAVDELPESARDRLLGALIERTGRGDRLLIVEPLARSAAPWWRRWAEAAVARGGRADEWRFRLELPSIVARLDRAAGLDHRELTGRSLWLAGR